MKFHLAINMERMDSSTDMRDVERHTREMVQMADRGGFDIAWAAEHHALEMTIAPNPFQLLTWWGAHTERIRLGSAVAVAAYWHPINLAGEAAMTDLMTGGRLEFGIGSGAYQREFDRMRPDMDRADAWKYMDEMLPVLKKLWTGDYEHNGNYWQFPRATSVPRPLQQPHPPCWVAARAPVTFDYAVRNDCNILTWPLTRPISEAETYRQRLDDALAGNPGHGRPEFAVMRHTCAYDSRDDWKVPVDAVTRQLGMFENLFRNLGDVEDGFPKRIPLEDLENREEFDPEMLHQNLMFGTPGEIIDKLRRYEALGVDSFVYLASFGLGMEEQKRSLELFCEEVIPALQ
jgi:alkanesulfonate monooxygenase SsuD/methylene tetrahydromethanopterin reductase-like flavin-dependent oxidoreductase (luciferase family)